MDFHRERTGGHFHPISLAFALLILLVVAISSAAAAKVDVPTPLSAKAPQADGYRQYAYMPECNPDWVAVSSPNPGTGLNVLSGVAAVSASDVWAVGYYQSSSLYQTVALHWDGSAWSVVPSPNVGSDNNYLNGVVAVSADDVWAVGYYAAGTGTTETLTLHWDGSSWNVIPSPSVASSFNFLSSVAAVSADDVWAVGYYVQSGIGQTLTMHWDASAWNIVPSPNPGTMNSLLRGVTAISSNDVWAVGLESNSSTNDRTLTIHWDGSAWSVVSSPSVGPETNLLFSVDAISTADVWAVGFYYVGGLGQTLVLHWDGSMWSVVPSPDPGISHTLRAVTAESANDVWAVGNYDDNSSNNHTLVLHWNGSAWSVSSSSTAGSTSNELYGVAVVSASDAWAVGDYNSGGIEQTQVVRYEPCSGTPAPTPGTATASPTSTQVLATSTPVPTECVPTWAVVNSPNVGTLDNELRAVAAVSATDIWAVGYSGNSEQGYQTLTEHWDGTSWSVVPSPNLTSYLNFLQGAAAISSDDVWAVGYYKGPSLDDPSETLTIHWDGTLWSVVPSVDPDPQNNRLLGVTAISHNDVWAVGFLQDYNGVVEIDHTITEHWDGSAWSVVPSPNPSDFTYLYGIAATSSNDVWAVGLYHTSKDNALAMHWDGNAWDVVAVPNMGTADNELYAVTIISADDVWAVGKYVEYGGPNQLEYTLTEHWDGTSWSVVSSPNVGSLSNTLNAVAALSPNDIWAVGEYSNASWHDQTLTEHWDGSTWSVVSSPSLGTPNWLLGVAAISSNDVWAVGLDSTPYRTLTEHYSSACSEATPLPIGSPTGTPTSVATSTETDTPGPAGTATVTGSPGSTSTPTETVTGTPPNETVTATPTACAIAFEDVPAGSTFYPFVQCLACRGIINGYPCGGPGEPCNGNNYPYFRPGNNVTRGQFSKIAAISAGFNEPPGAQQYEDVPVGTTFYDYIWRLTDRGYVTGYPCRGAGEPCGPNNLPYFRPNANVTRGQLSKIDANAAGLTQPPGAQQFEDVLPGSTFYYYIWRLTDLGYMNGYPCGGVGEPCGPSNLPYFRPGANATRGQASKIVSNTFFPTCQPPHR